MLHALETLLQTLCMEMETATARYAVLTLYKVITLPVCTSVTSHQPLCPTQTSNSRSTTLNKARRACLSINNGVSRQLWAES
jgi:hypothetical protein